MLLKRMLGYATRLLVTTLALVGWATKPGQIWQDTPVPPIDARRGLGLEGYDVVAYFTDHQPIWESRRSRNIRVGDVNWPLIPKLETPSGTA